jgi:hypothetical protein
MTNTATQSSLSGLVSLEPAWFRSGPLWSSGGVTVSSSLIGLSTFRDLCVEAQAAYAGSDRQESTADDNADGRGGMPGRALSTAGGGLVQDAWYLSSTLRNSVSELCGGPMRPSGNRGSYSYYLEPGDFLGLHLDVVTCDVTIITVLDDTSPDHGGALAVRRSDREVGLSHLRRVVSTSEEVIKVVPGQSIVIQGGVVPHRVIPLGAGQRVISALCFEAVCEC